jgi:hypothetical protein
MKIYRAETYCLPKHNQTLVVATQKPGHEVKADKPERMFILCAENVEEFHNMEVSNTSFCVGITQTKIKSVFTNKQRAF